jgi:hypothetical protein
MITDTDADRLKREYERGRKEALEEFEAAKEAANNILASAIHEVGYVFFNGDGMTMEARAVATMQHLKEDLDASESRCHEFAKRVVEHIPPVFDGPPGWRCFHCREYFTNSEKAQLHFGASEMDSPICQIHPDEIRKMEVELARYRNEDSDLERKIHSLEADQAVALLREEENGYDKGLRDGMGISRIHEMVMAVLEPVLGCCRSYGSGDTDCKDAPKDWAPTSVEWCLHCRVREKLEQLMLGPVKKS